VKMAIRQVKRGKKMSRNERREDEEGKERTGRGGRWAFNVDCLQHRSHFYSKALKFSAHRKPTATT